MKTKKCLIITVALVLLISSCAVFPGLAGYIDASSPTASIGPKLSGASVSNAGIDMSTKAASATSSQVSQIENSSAMLPSSAELSVLFINVGKADATLVLYADKAYLIDTGAKNSAPQLIGALNLYGIGTLDVFLTHTDADHIGGMTALAKNFNIGTMYSAEISEIKKKGGNKIAELAEKLSLTHKKLRALDKVEITQDTYFEILGPLVYNEGDDNDNSLVIRLHVNGRTLLFTGDMQFAQEETLLNAGADLNADILKVSNHGNPDATSERFAAAVSPQFAVISTDTTVDEDSANARVKSALRGAIVYITQDYQCGVLVTVQADGSIEFATPIISKANANVAIAGIDKDAQTIRIKNNGAGIDISGFIIMSQRGSEVFVFPKGAYLEAGQSVTVSGQVSGGDYDWTNESAVWHEKKEDIGILYDRFGNELSRAQ